MSHRLEKKLSGTISTKIFVKKYTLFPHLFHFLAWVRQNSSLCIQLDIHFRSNVLQNYAKVYLRDSRVKLSASIYQSQS